MTALLQTPLIAAPAPSLKVFSFETLDAMARIRPAWEYLEARDPEGSIYLSWRWMNAVFTAFPGRWRVLAVREGGRLVALLPLKYRVHWSSSQGRLVSEIEAAGRLLYSEYIGFLCDPACEDLALRVLATNLKTRPWSSFSLKYEASAGRMAKFLSHFPKERFDVREKDYFINGGTTDNLKCPRLSLPDDFESYLTLQLGKNMRQKIRRFTRKYLDSGEMRVEWMEGARAAQGVDILMQLWKSKWLPIKGPGQSQRVEANYRRNLAAAARLGLLRVPMLFQGERPVGALGHVLDPDHGRVHFIVAGRDENVSGGHIGPLLHSQSIQWAIANRYRVYDFAHGDEAYKYGYGAQDVRVNYFSIRRRAAEVAQLDPLCQPLALDRAMAYLDDGDKARGQTIITQISALGRAAAL